MSRIPEGGTNFGLGVAVAQPATGTDGNVDSTRNVIMAAVRGAMVA